MKLESVNTSCKAWEKLEHSSYDVCYAHETKKILDEERDLKDMYLASHDPGNYIAKVSLYTVAIVISSGREHTCKRKRTYFS